MELELQELKKLVGICALILFILWDVWDTVMSYRNRRYWVPGKALILSGLTVQFIGFFDTKNVNLYGKSEHKDLAMLVEKQISIDIARVTVCVFMGYVLPGMALPEIAGRWTNLAALVMSLSMHIATEIYALQKVENARVEIEGVGLFVSSSVSLSVVAICLVIYLGGSALVGKSVRDRQKMPEILVQNEVNGWEIVKFKILKSLMVAHSWEAAHLAVSFAFSPVVGVIVTACVALVGAKVILLRSVLHGNVGLAFYLQCGFILMGWLLILCRWLTALVYYASDMDRKLEDVYGYVRRLRGLLYFYVGIALNRPVLLWESILKGENLTCFIVLLVPCMLIFCIVFFPCILIFKTVQLSLWLLIEAISLVFFFSYFCWQLSALVCGLCKSKESESEDMEDVEIFKEYKAAMERILAPAGEDPARVWKANQQSFEETKSRMEELYGRAQRDDGVVVSLIERSDPENRQKFAKELDNTRLWYLTAVATSYVILKLKAWGWNLDVALDSLDLTSDWLLPFLDCPDNIYISIFRGLFESYNTKAFQIYKSASDMWSDMRWYIQFELRSTRGESGKVRRKTVEEVVGWIQNVVSSDEKRNGNVDEESSAGFCARAVWKWKERWNESTSLEEIDKKWKEKPFSDALKCLLKPISSRSYSDENDLIEMIQNCVVDVFGCGVMQLPDVAVTYCRQWAEQLEVEKIKEAAELAGTACGLREHINRDRERGERVRVREGGSEEIEAAEDSGR